MNNNTAPTEGRNSDQTGNLAGSSSHDLLAFSSILGGLLASGHFTQQLDTKSDDTGLIRDDYGKEWKSHRDDDPTIYCRYMPRVLGTAEELLKAARLICEANAKDLARRALDSE